jgi:hypothetical protein
MEEFMKTVLMILSFTLLSSMSFAESLKADCASVNQGNDKSRVVASAQSKSTKATSKK